MNRAVLRENFLFIGQQWWNSLAVFVPANFKLFLLVSLNAVKKTVQSYFKLFWWLVLINVLLSIVFLVFFDSSENFLFFLLLKSFGRRTAYFSIFVAILLVRPSVNKKGYRYLLQYIKSFLFFVVFHLGSLFLWIAMPSFRFLFNNYLFLLIAYPLCVGTLFFFYDSGGGFMSAIKSIIQSAKMMFNNWPFYVAGLLFFDCAFFLLSTVVRLMLSFVDSSYAQQILFYNVAIFFYFIVYLCALCFFNTFYIKKAHENFELYH